MTDAPRVLPIPRKTMATALALLVGGLISIIVATNVADPTPASNMMVFSLAYLAVIAYVVMRPFPGFLIMCGTLFMLVVVAATTDRYVNTFDALLPFVFMTTLLGHSRMEARIEAARFDSPEHEEIRKASHNFAFAGVLYLAICTISLIPILIHIGTDAAMEITFAIARVVEGALMFPLGLWLLTSEKRVSHTITAIYLAGALFVGVNLVQVFMSGAYRAGITWVINHPNWPVESANEAGATMVILWALILADHHFKPRVRTFPFLGIVLFMLLLTQSRSGLLALVTFTVLSLPKIRWPYIVVIALLVPIVLKFTPEGVFERLGRSVTMEKGSFEVYSILIRVYGYQSALRVFASNWLFGVGYLSCQYVSHHYNDLNLFNLGAENFFLETAAGLGVIGLASVAFCYVRLFQLGRVVLRLAPKRTRAYSLARVHFPLIMALSVANLTGDNFMGLVGTGQIALWVVLLVRATHLSLKNAPNAGVAAVPSVS